MKTRALLRASAIVGSLCVWSLEASAQTAPVEQESERPTEEQSGPSENSEVTVTGTRIRLPNTVSQEPIVTIGSDYLEARNLTNVADALNEIPGFRGSVTPNGTQGSFGQGVNFVNAYGLGTNRTLTLVNGRRVVTSNVASVFGNASGGTQVDLNILPAIIIDSVDRVGVGGAPIYGSDAIAGTVNIKLRNRFNGLEARATTGITERGDNQRINLSAIAGRDFADGRGNITIAGMYETVKGMVQNDRDFYRDNLGFLQNPTSAEAARFGPAGRTPGNDGRANPNIGFNNSTTDGFPGSLLVRDLSIASMAYGGLIIAPAGATSLRSLDYARQFDQFGNLVPFNSGIVFQGSTTAPPITGSAARSSSTKDGFRFSDVTQITGDQKRIAADIFANFELTEEVKLFAEGMYYHGRGDQLLRQPTFNSSLFGGVSSALNFSVDNPFLTAQARQTLTQAGYSTFRLSRANLDLADITGYSENDLYRGVLGASSEFKLGGRDYQAEIAVTYGRNDFVDYNQAINQQNFINAVNVGRNAAGEIVCTTTPTVLATPGFRPVADAACRPLNLFGQGVASREALDYVIQDVSATSWFEQFVLNANFGGSPFDIFGNPVGFNAGFEHRQEKASFTPDAFQQQGLGRSVAIAPVSGKYTLNEVFGEVLVPLISPNNNFVIYNADVFARGRYVNNTVNGNFFSWSAGGSIQPIRDIRFRGNFTRSFRAPSVVELFSPITNTFTTVTDYCSPANRNAGPVPDIRNRNCTAFLARYPTATPLAAASATVPGRSGGNPSLQNEEANSYELGVVLQPRFVPGLTFSVDYLNIKLRKPISSLTVAQIGSACFDNASFNADDPANGNAFCSLIRRDAAGQVISDPASPAVNAGYVNGVRYDFEGLQAVLEYRTRLNGLKLPGTLIIGGDVYFQGKRLNDVTGVAPARTDGTISDPQFQGQARFRYRTDSWGFSTFVNYTGQQLTSRFNRGPNPNDTREFDKYKDFITVDANIFFDVTDRFTLSLTATNLTDRISQRYYGYYIPGVVNDAFGRRFAITAAVKY